jgi:hypothetical protein
MGKEEIPIREGEKWKIGKKYFRILLAKFVSLPVGVD